MAKKTSLSPTKKSIHHVDYYPNRVGLAVAAIAALSLLILGFVAFHV